jgi:hypothetical protein
VDETNPGKSEQPKDAYTGRPDQGLTRNLGAGAGGATEWGGGNKNHPSKRVKPGPQEEPTGEPDSTADASLMTEGIGGMPDLKPEERATVSDVDEDNVKTERPKPQI